MATTKQKNKWVRTSLKRAKGKGPLSKATLAGRKHAIVMEKTEPGTGERFASLTKQLASRPGVKTPGALSAWIGRKKYGKGKFQAMAVEGKKK